MRPLTVPEGGPDGGQGRSGECQFAHQATQLHRCFLAVGIAGPVVPAQSGRLQLESVHEGCCGGPVEGLRLAAVQQGEAPEAVVEVAEEVAGREVLGFDETPVAPDTQLGQQRQADPRGGGRQVEGGRW